MSDDDHDHLRSDNTVFVATTLAGLVLAGSAALIQWRKGLGLWHGGPQAGQDSSPGSDSLGDSRGLDGHRKLHSKPHPKLASDEGDTKASRSKERRRRGKDPVKEILKSGGAKKLKAFSLKSYRFGEDIENPSPTSSLLPRIPETGSNSHQRFRGESVSTSSRSVSSSTSTRGLLNVSQANRAEDVDAAPYPSSSASESFSVASHDPQLPLDDDDNDGQESRSSLPESAGPPIVLSLSSSKSGSVSSADSTETVSTTPTTPPFESNSVPLSDVPSHIEPSQPSTSQASSSSKRPAAPPKFTGPWDWDGVGSSGPDTGYRKPPRFRAESKSKSRSPMPSVPSIPYASHFTSPSSSTSNAEPLPSTSSTGGSPLLTSVSTEDQELGEPFEFPTLNAVPNRPAPGVNSNGSSGSSGSTATLNSASGTGTSNTPRRAPTPRQTPSSGGGGTPPPSLSTQTQLASLRGALEAARMREEKARAEIERCGKEIEMMRWESGVWRRREAELQAQIHHLMHQLQASVALFTGVSSPLSHPSVHLQPPNPNPTSNPNTNPTSPSGTVNTNGNGFSSSSSSPGPQTRQQQQQPHPHPLLAMPPNLNGNGMIFPHSMLSPMPMPSPFFGYPSPLSASGHPHSLPHTPHSANGANNAMFGMFFPPPNMNMSASSSTSNSGSSSVGSLSPDLAATGVINNTLFETGFDRGRRRTRTAGARMGGWEAMGVEGEMELEDSDERDLAQVEEDYSHGGDSYGHDREHQQAEGDARVDINDGDEDDEDDEDFNGILVDAILKRPGSIRVGSRKGRKKEKEREEREKQNQMEFSYPSISDFGNITSYRARGATGGGIGIDGDKDAANEQQPIGVEVAEGNRVEGVEEDDQP